MIQEPPSGLVGRGEGTGPSVMARPHRGPGYVTRWLSATGKGWIREEKGGELAIIAEVAALAGARRPGMFLGRLRTLGALRSLGRVGDTGTPFGACGERGRGRALGDGSAIPRTRLCGKVAFSHGMGWIREERLDKFVTQPLFHAGTNHKELTKIRYGWYSATTDLPSYSTATMHFLYD